MANVEEDTCLKSTQPFVCEFTASKQLLDFLEKAEGKNSDFAEKQFVLAGGGTLNCPILTSGGYGAEIQYQGDVYKRQVLHYLVNHSTDILELFHIVFLHIEI